MALSAAMAVLILGGCTQTDEPESGKSTAPDDDFVTFGAYVSNTSVSRASVSNIHTLKQLSFGVFASITGTDDFQDNPVSGGFTPNYMYNQKVAWQGFANRDSSWVYEPAMLWPGTQKVSFFAYSPHTDKANAAIRSWSGINDSGSPKITFSLGTDIDRQVDLLYANALNLINSPQVQLNFKHALSRMRIQFTIDIDSNSTFIVNKLSFKSTDLGSSGELNLGNGRWTKIKGTTEHIFTAADADALKKGFMVIPPDQTATLEITADYTLTTTDSKLPGGSFKTSYVVSSPFSLRLEAGKSYCLNLRLRRHSIEVSASLNDWEDENHTWESDQDHKNKFE
ncbi:MAG: fimbrillin family protein [Bacteroides sp.]|nr:fimbrillin family protein [Bacteroides sp.]